MIRLPDSELLIVPGGKDNYFVRNVRKETFIIFNRKFISITRGTYKYDALINDKIFENVSRKFIEKLVARKQKFKDEMYAQHKIILKGIIGDDEEFSPDDETS